MTKEERRSRESEDRSFTSGASYQHQYTSSLKRPSPDVMDDLFKIGPATLVRDQYEKQRHRILYHTELASTILPHIYVCKLLFMYVYISKQFAKYKRGIC